MKKYIAVQEGLHEVAKLLKSYGYRVTTVDNSQNPIDVIIYSSSNNEYLAHNMAGEIQIPSYNQFVKMINIDEVGMEDIISRIEELQ